MPLPLYSVLFLFLLLGALSPSRVSDLNRSPAVATKKISSVENLTIPRLLMLRDAQNSSIA